jgi:CheY-like chemotaxis protein
LIDLVSLLLLWESFKPIVCIGFEPLADILRRRPEDIVLCAPGVVYHQITDNELPVLERATERNRWNSGLINPFIKPRVDMALQARHSYANFTAMLLFKSIQEKLGFEISNTDEINNFEQSPEALLLKKYFGFDSIKINDDEKSEFLLEYSNSKRILLIDDQAHEGWTQIISNMVYGKPNDGKLMVEDFAGIDITTENIKEKLENRISTDKPWLVLLDLRLKDEKAGVQLTDLSGFKVLLWLKMHEKFKGLPVIMFTATTNAETVKILLDAGVEMVWTKPGLDEQLSVEGIKLRYKQLLGIIKDILTQKRFSDLKGFNKDETPFISPLELQKLLLDKLAYIRYRYFLKEESTQGRINNTKIETDLKLSDFNFIYFDANAFIANQADYHKLISAFYLLGMATAKTEQMFIKDTDRTQTTHTFEMPKVVVMNAVYDELVKIVKMRPENISRSAMMSLALINQLFKGAYIRTEFFDEPSSALKNPKENVYADPYLLDELATVLITKKIKKKFFYDTYWYEYPASCKALVVTGDKALQNKIGSLQCPNGNKVSCIDVETFVKLSEKWFI